MEDIQACKQLFCSEGHKFVGHLSIFPSIYQWTKWNFSFFVTLGHCKLDFSFPSDPNRYALSFNSNIHSATFLHNVLDFLCKNESQDINCIIFYVKKSKQFTLFDKSSRNFISIFTCCIINMYFLNDRLFENCGLSLFLVTNYSVRSNNGNKLMDKLCGGRGGWGEDEKLKSNLEYSALAQCISACQCIKN